LLYTVVLSIELFRQMLRRAAQLFSSYTSQVILLSLIMMAPLYILLAAATPISNDFYLYSLILKHTSTQLWNGDFLLKWFSETNAGMGSPVGLFYGPFVYYLTSLLQFLDGVDPNGFLRVGITVNLCLMLSAISAKQWLLAEKFSHAQAEFGGMLYLLLPYVFGTWSPASFFAAAILPLALYYTINCKDVWAQLLLAALHAALLTSHPPSYLVLGPFLFSYLYYMQRDLIKLIYVAVLSLLLSAYYLVPFFANQQFVDFTAFTSGKYDVHVGFYSYDMMLATLMIVLPPLFFLGISFKKVYFKKLKFWYISLLIVLFMLTPLFIPILMMVPVIKNLQFSGRFLILLKPIVSYLFGYLIAKEPRVYGIKVVMLFLSIALCWNVPTDYFVKEPGGYISYLYKNQIVMAPEYITSAMKSHEMNYYLMVKKYEHLPKASFFEGNGEVEISDFSGRAITLKVDIKSDAAIVLLKRISFPGWEVFINGENIHPEEVMFDHDGLIALALPNGKQVVQMHWSAKGEYLGYLLSLMGILIALISVALFTNTLRMRFSEPVVVQRLRYRN